MTTQEVIDSGPANAVSAACIRSYYGYNLMLRHPKGWRSVNHPQDPGNPAEAKALARRLYPDLPWVKPSA